MLSKFIYEDLTRRNRKLSNNKLSAQPLIVPIDLIQGQKSISEKISVQCQKELRSEVHFIKRQIQNEALKKKQKRSICLITSNKPKARKTIMSKDNSRQKINNKMRNSICFSNIVKEAQKNGLFVKKSQIHRQSCNGNK